jgi:hypothetical protein
MTRIDDDPIASGRAALSRLEKDQTFEDWVLVGQALKIGRTNAKKASGSFEANMASWLKAEGFHAVDKGARSRLLNIIDELPQVLAWREKLPSAERLKYNHPNSIWRKFHAPDKPRPRVKRMPLAERIKLAKILGQLGSDQKGIVNNAISQAKGMLDKHNLSWFDILGCSRSQ